jgi:hypothetical protein
MVERTSQALSSLAYEGKTRFAYRQMPGFRQAGADALADRDPSTLSQDDLQIFQLVVGEVDLAQIQQRQLEHLGRFSEALGNLESMVHLQANGDPLSQAFWLEDFACNLIELKSMIGCSGVRTFSGWYPQLLYRSIVHDRRMEFDEESGVGKFDAIVADVHTDVPCEVCGDPGSVLHEGIGHVNMAFIVAEFGGKPGMFSGPVLSHFEFELIGPPRRLADSEWSQSISGGEGVATPLRPEWSEIRDAFGNIRKVPQPPPWTRDYLVPVK